jgi:F-type H+-transporting ATPase subunit a
VNGAIVLAAGDIEVGHHRTATVFGMTFNVDTIYSSIIAGLIVFGLGLYMAKRAHKGRPSKLQLLWETIVGAVQKQVESAMGPVAPFVVPLAVTLFMFILISNWLELIPSQHWLVSPSADINMTLALALLVVFWVHIAHIKQRGLGAYFKHYAQPYPALIPLTVLEEIVKPFTLALRLFGNIFAGGIMLALIGLMPPALLWLPNGLWKGFDAVIGLIQAFIFALLTILYFGFALGEEEH